MNIKGERLYVSPTQASIRAAKLKMKQSKQMELGLGLEKQEKIKKQKQMGEQLQQQGNNCYNIMDIILLNLYIHSI
jgi:hypothetical protein